MTFQSRLSDRPQFCPSSIWAMAAYDPETIETMRLVLDEVWNSLSPKQRDKILKSDIALRIFGAVERGERHHDRLVAAALDQPSNAL